MNSKRIAQTNQQQKSETSEASGILQRTAVRSVADAGVQFEEQEAQPYSKSAFSKDFSRVPISTTRPQPIQAKLTIGEPGDKYEQEADRVASQVVQQINTPSAAQSTQGKSLQRQDAAEEEIQTKPSISVLQRSPIPTQVKLEAMPEDEEVQAKSILQGRDARGSGEPSTDVESAINSVRGSGQPLDAGLQQSMGQAIGADFSGVKVHTDTQADQLNQSIQARAFTTGQDVFFRSGEYNPGSRGGQELIAHELTHVVQQNADKHSIATIQRKGVKSELTEAANKFEDFQNETDSINELREEVSNNIYNKYKPPTTDGQHYSNKTNRDKINKGIDNKTAQTKAKSLNRWTDTAVESAQRIYEELKKAVEYADSSGHYYHDITMGMDTDKQPDAYISNTALEVKKIDSPTVGAVDEHIKKGSEQLAKREVNEHDQTNIKNWRLSLVIGKENNPWPFTPVKFDSLLSKNQLTQDLIKKTAIERIKKYKNSKTKVKYMYHVESANKSIGIFDVEV